MEIGDEFELKSCQKGKSGFGRKRIDDRGDEVAAHSGG